MAAPSPVASSAPLSMRCDQPRPAKLGQVLRDPGRAMPTATTNVVTS